MIEVTRINDTKFCMNSDLIETVEETPDTVVTLTNGKKYIIKESCEELKKLIIIFKKQIFGSEN